MAHVLTILSSFSEIADADAPLLQQLVSLKSTYPGLQVIIAVGGWDFSYVFSKLQDVIANQYLKGGGPDARSILFNDREYQQQSNLYIFCPSIPQSI
jgi:hypothetical protein